MKKQSMTRLTALATSTIVSVGSANADVLVRYEFPSPGSSVEATQTLGDLSGTEVTLGSYFNSTKRGFSTSTDSIFTRLNAYDPTKNSIAGALSDNNHVTFTLTNNASDPYDLLSYTADFYFTGTSGIAANSEFSLALLVDANIDGFDAGDVLGTKTYVFGSEGNSFPTVADTILFDLSALGNLGVGQSLEFRLYGYTNASGTNGGEPNVGRIDNLTVNGGVVPEPGSLALLGLGGLLIARRRRV